MKANKNILITGASGFIGSWLAKQLKEEGYTLYGIDLRVPIEPEIWDGFLMSSCETVDFDVLLGGKSLFAVFHLAGGASVGYSVMDPYGDFSSLLPGTARLAIYMSKRHMETRFFFFSSAAVYGNSYDLPIDETFATLPISPYGVHKFSAETLLLNYSRIFNLRVTILRVFSVYGEGLRKQLIWDLSQKAIQAIAVNASTVDLKGTGREKRDFLHVKDLSNMVSQLLSLEIASNLIVNIASGKQTEVTKLADILIEKLALPIKVTFNGIIPHGDPHSLVSNNQLLESFDIRPKISLENGLERVAKWIKNSE